MTSQQNDLETLLDLNDLTVVVEDCYWVKFEAHMVPVTDQIPHGIRYTLTLHRPDGSRILGFDNSHPIKPAGNPYKYAGQIIKFDHEHVYTGKPNPKAIPYLFDSPGQLIADFWDAVDAALLQEKTS